MGWLGTIWRIFSGKNVWMAMHHACFALASLHPRIQKNFNLFFFMKRNANHRSGVRMIPLACVKTCGKLQLSRAVVKLVVKVVVRTVVNFLR